MWGSNGFTSTLIPTDLSVQILPTLAVVVSPLLKEFRPLEINKIIRQVQIMTNTELGPPPASLDIDKSNSSL